MVLADIISKQKFPCEGGVDLVSLSKQCLVVVIMSLQVNLITDVQV